LFVLNACYIFGTFGGLQVHSPREAFPQALPQYVNIHVNTNVSFFIPTSTYNFYCPIILLYNTYEFTYCHYMNYKS